MNDYTLHAIIAILTLLLGGETAYIIKILAAARATKQRREDQLMQQLLTELSELKESFSFLKK
jgi:cytochrome c553